MGYAHHVRTVSVVAVPVWRALRLASAPMSVTDLHRACRAHPNAINQRIKRWERAGLVNVVNLKPRRYVMAPGAPANPPRIGQTGRTVRGPSHQDRLWRAMRSLRPRFTLADLTLVTGVGKAAAQSFVSMLVRAGFVRQLAKPSGRAGSAAAYELMGIFGPRTPKVTHRICPETGKRRRFVIDLNTGRTIDVSKEEAADGAR